LAAAAPSTLTGAIQRLQLSAAQGQTLEWSGEKSDRAATLLMTGGGLRPSRIYRLLCGLPNEAVIMILAKGLATKKRGPTRRLIRRVTRYLTQDRHVTTTVSGDALKQLGLRPGPHYKRILDQLLDERLDGRITDAAQERQRARLLVQQSG